MVLAHSDTTSREDVDTTAYSDAEVSSITAD
jgi:hypothetical protein